MREAYALQVHVSEPTIQDGLRANHPRLGEYIRNGIKLGWGNEHIARVTGAPPELISRERSKVEKEKRTK